MYTNKSLYEEEYIRNRVLTTLLKKLSLEDYEVDQVLKGSENSMINSLVKLFAVCITWNFIRSGRLINYIFSFH